MTMSCFWFQQSCRQVSTDGPSTGEPELILKDIDSPAQDCSITVPKTSRPKTKLASAIQLDEEMGRTLEVKKCLPPVARPKSKGAAIQQATEVNQAAEASKCARAQPTGQHDADGCSESHAEHIVHLKITKDAGRCLGLKVQRQAAPHLKKSSSLSKAEMDLLAEGAEVLSVIDVGAENHLSQCAQGFEEKDFILAVTKVGMIDTSSIRATPDQMIEWMRATVDFECVILRHYDHRN